MKNKKVIIAIIAVVLILIIAISVIFVNKQKSETEIKETLSTFISNINDKNYEQMYEMISSDSKTKINKEDFIKINKNIYEGIDAYDIKINISEVCKENNSNKVSFTENMSTSAGNIEFSNTCKIVKENKEYKINWVSSMIFPELRDTDKVRISTIKSSRGEILDRNGIKLAENGEVSTVGIVPRKIRRK